MVMDSRRKDSGISSEMIWGIGQFETFYIHCCDSKALEIPQDDDIVCGMYCISMTQRYKWTVM